MFRLISNPVRNAASSLALAMAMTGAAVTGTAVFAPAAMAQEKPSYSEQFVGVYSPVAALTQGEAPNFEAARAQLPAVEAAIQNADDRYAAGNLYLVTGNRLSDGTLQRRGLELMLASGKVEPERVGQFQSFVGNLALNAKDYPAAERALQAAIAAGYMPAEAATDILAHPQTQLLQIYLLNDEGGKAISAVQQRLTAGEDLPERWIQLGLQGALDTQNNAAAGDLAAALVAGYPTEKNLGLAQQIAISMNDFAKPAELDLLRLMRESGSLNQKAQYQRYIEDADPRIMSNEVVDVLAEGLREGHFTSSDPYYVEVKQIVDQRMASDRREVDGLVRDADNGAGRDALAAADVLYSLDDFARAETYYMMAADKGGVDAGTALTRAGIAQYKQGKYAEAQATFDRVSGNHAPVAKLWSAYAATKS